MSTPLPQSSEPSPFLSANTVARSILREKKIRKIETVDLRTRRFGYNPGFLMEMDSRLTGLQRVAIDPGVLILFETAPVKRPRWSVDPGDNGPLDEEVELLAGEGLNSVGAWHAHMGWRELIALRGMENQHAVDLFYMIHPPLAECVEQGSIPACPYDLEVCITCRAKWLESIKTRVSTRGVELWSQINESVSVGRRYMETQWLSWIAEMGRRFSSQGQSGGMQELAEGHLYFMRQLHKQSPSDAELAKVNAGAAAQASALKESMTELATLITQNRNVESQEEMNQMKAQMAEMQKTLALFAEKNAGENVGKVETAPATPPSGVTGEGGEETKS